MIDYGCLDFKKEFEISKEDGLFWDVVFFGQFDLLERFDNLSKIF